MNAKIEVATRPGPSSGSTTWRNAPKRLAPSTIADSSRSIGMPSMKPRRAQMVNGSVKMK